FLIAHLDEGVTALLERRDARQRAATTTRVVVQLLAGDSALHHDDRHLVADHDDLTGLDGVTGLVDGREHARAHLEVGLAPARLHGVHHPRPRLRVEENSWPELELLALELVERLEQPLLGRDRQAEVAGPRLGRLLRAM